MAKLSDCPDVTELKNLITGRLPVAQLEILLEHLELCAVCLDRVSTISAADTLVDALNKEETSRELPNDPVLIHLMTRLTQMGEGRQPIAASDLAVENDNGMTADPRSSCLTCDIGRNDGTEEVAPDSETELFAFLAPPQQPDELGRLGSYRILKKLGAGGMGIVFLAEDTLLHRKVALKTMRPSIAAHLRARQRFLREACAAASIEHKNIVAIYQVGETSKMPYLAMPVLKGESLSARVSRGEKIPLDEALRIAEEIAEGLAAAHAVGLIHRDIKPGNVWLETPLPLSSRSSAPVEPGRVKLLDFGLARSQISDGKLTESGAMVGTPAYMAPEQARGENIDTRADLFSLGCVLYLMLTGNRPFRGDNTMTVLASLALEQPPLPSIINKDVPKAVSSLTMRLLAKDPAERPASAAEVVNELAALRAGEPVCADTAQVPAGEVNAIPEGGRPLRWAGILVVIGLLVFAPLGYFFGGTVVRIATNKGELVIESSDPNIEISVKGNGVVLYDKVKERRFILTAGEYDVDVQEITADGLRFATKKFIITRGGKETFQARLESVRGKDKELKSPVVTIGSGEVRKAVEQILVLGAKVTIGPRLREISEVKDLPAGAIQVVAVTIRHKKLGKDGLRCLRPLRDVENLILHGLDILDADLAHLKTVTKLKDLDLTGCNELTEAGLIHLQPLNNLESLTLVALPVAGNGLVHLKPLTKLKRFNLSRTRLEDQDLLHLQAWPKLEALNLYKTYVTENGLVHLRHLTHLDQLAIPGIKINDGRFADLKPLENLKLLELTGTGIGDGGLAQLQGMVKLTHLYLTSTKISSAGLRSLKGMNDLSVLSLWDTKIDDAGLEHLKKFTRLHMLNLKDTKVTLAGVTALQKALPNCNIDSNFRGVNKPGDKKKQ